MPKKPIKQFLNQFGQPFIRVQMAQTIRFGPIGLAALCMDGKQKIPGLLRDRQISTHDELMGMPYFDRPEYRGYF